MDNPGNLFADEEGNVFTLETDLKKLVKISPDGVKTVLVADNFLNKNYTITGDEAGNLFTANRTRARFSVGKKLRANCIRLPSYPPVPCVPMAAR